MLRPLSFFVGCSRFAAVSKVTISTVRFVGLYDENVLTRIKYGYIVVPALQIVHAYIKQAGNGA
jgi:hypothetical protein